MMISSFKTDTFCQFTHKRLNHANFFLKINKILPLLTLQQVLFCVFVATVLKLPHFTKFIKV